MSDAEPSFSPYDNIIAGLKYGWSRFRLLPADRRSGQDRLRHRSTQADARLPARRRTAGGASRHPGPGEVCSSGVRALPGSGARVVRPVPTAHGAHRRRGDRVRRAQARHAHHYRRRTTRHRKDRA